jgi:hypothetical protein
MRKAFNFFHSYYDVAKELNDKDRLSFLDALLKKQFEGKDTELSGMAKFAYLSQKHSIETQIKGYFDKTKDAMFAPCQVGTEGGSKGGYVAPSVQEKGKEQEKEQVQLKVNNIEDRKLKFAHTLKPFLEIYGKDLLNEFYHYWTEPNKSNTKMKFELQQTWSLERRLTTWSKNDKNFNRKQNGTETRTSSQNDAINKFRERIVSAIAK